MLPLICTLRSTLAFVLAAMVLVWILSLLKRDASVVDLFWGAGFVLVAWLACWLNHPVHERAWLMAVLTTVWGLRLSLYLLWRNWGHGEDRRYPRREQNGPRFWLSSLWRVFLLQGVILWLVSLPLQGMAACNTANSPGVLDGLGTILWGIGLLFEAGGDWQLARFQANPANAGQVMERRPMATHSPSQLLRGLLHLVGLVSDRGGGRSLVDRGQPACDVIFPLEGFRRHAAGKDNHRASASVCCVSGTHQRLLPRTTAPYIGTEFVRAGVTFLAATGDYGAPGQYPRFPAMSRPLAAPF